MYCQKHSTQKHSTANTTILAIFAVTLLVWATHAPAQEEKVLHSFNSSDGASPDAGLVFDSAGNLYGTTYSGGSHGSGTVFELAPAAGGKWKEKVLYSFSHSSDGFGPAAALIMDGAGNLYGTAAGGGAHSAGLVFELTPETGGGWTETVLHDFSLGTAPLSGLVRDAAGNLYGTGGAGGIGLVFELLPSSGGSWTAKVLYKFNTTDGFFPQGGLLLGASGNLYGTTEYGGTDSYGTVYELKPETGGRWAEKVLYNFGNNGTDGYYPTANLIEDGMGNLYGMTTGTGEFGGTVFELTRGQDGSWTESVLHSFVDNGSDGYGPTGPLVFDGSGNLYGTTGLGGANSGGTVFELSPNGDGTWTETILHNFGINASDGHYPYSGLVFDTRGNLYGTTAEGGANDAGTVFEVRP
jgi:uncharacterized repeat protein (TIGR03803 family)